MLKLADGPHASVLPSRSELQRRSQESLVEGTTPSRHRLRSRLNVCGEGALNSLTWLSSSDTNG